MELNKKAAYLQGLVDGLGVDEYHQRGQDHQGHERTAG